mmetsp:Transcript_6686/g.16687  ORF Transcript_6686/g.16687 Transcript_6686/m.16687 type:complete len:320 (-) Transcript_6686:41-1000(-)
MERCCIVRSLARLLASWRTIAGKQLQPSGSLSLLSEPSSFDPIRSDPIRFRFRSAAGSVRSRHRNGPRKPRRRGFFSRRIILPPDGCLDRQNVAGLRDGRRQLGTVHRVPQFQNLLIALLLFPRPLQRLAPPILVAAVVVASGTAVAASLLRFPPLDHAGSLVQDLQGDVAIETAIGLFVTALVPRQLDVDAGSVARVLLHPVRRPVGARNDGRRGRRRRRRQRSKRNSVSGAFALTDLRGRHHSAARKGRLEEVLHLPVNLVDVSLVLIIIVVVVVVVVFVVVQPFKCGFDTPLCTSICWLVIASLSFTQFFSLAQDC